MKSTIERAVAFKALGDPTRLKIFEYLCCCQAPVEIEQNGDVRPLSGATVGDVCCHLQAEAKASSTVSFHLKELRNAGLITMDRKGKNILCTVAPDVVEELGAYLLQVRSTRCTGSACDDQPATA